MGADLDRLRAQGTLEPILSYLTNARLGVPESGFPASMADVIRDGESLLIAGIAGNEQAKPVIVLKTRGPVDVEKVKNDCNARAPRNIHGHTVFRTETGKTAPDKKTSLGWLAFPGEQLVLMSEANEKDFAALLAAAAHPQPHPSAERIAEAKTTPLWAVLTFDARMKAQLNETFATEMAGVVPALQKGRSAVLFMELPEKDSALKCRLEVLCGDAALSIEVKPVAKDAKPTQQEIPWAYPGVDKQIKELEGKPLLALLGTQLSIQLLNYTQRWSNRKEPYTGPDFIRAILRGKIIPKSEMVYHLQDSEECLVTTPGGEFRVGIFYRPVGYIVLPNAECYWFFFEKDKN